MVNFRVKLKPTYVKKFSKDRANRLGTVVRIPRDKRQWIVVWDGRKTKQTVAINKLDLQTNVLDIVNSILTFKTK